MNTLHTCIGVLCTQLAYQQSSHTDFPRLLPPACSLLVEPMVTSADSSSAIPSRSMTSSVGVPSSSDVTSSSESPTQSLAVSSISFAPSSSISVAPSVAGSSSSSVYRAASSSPPPAVPTPTPSGPQGVHARIHTSAYTYVCVPV